MLVVPKDHRVLPALDLLRQFRLIEPGLVVEVEPMQADLPTHRVSRIGEPRIGSLTTTGLRDTLAAPEFTAGDEDLVFVSIRDQSSAECDTLAVALALGKDEMSRQGDQETHPQWIDVIAPASEDLASRDAPSNPQVITVLVEPQERASPRHFGTDIDPDHLAWHQATVLSHIAPLWIGAERGPFDGHIPDANSPVFVARGFVRGLVAPSVLAWAASKVAEATGLPTPPGCVAVAEDQMDERLEGMADSLISAARLRFEPHSPKRKKRWRIGPVDAVLYLVSQLIGVAHDYFRDRVGGFFEQQREAIEAFMSRAFFGEDGRVEVSLSAGALEETQPLEPLLVPDPPRLAGVVDALIDDQPVVDVRPSILLLSSGLRAAVDGGTGSAASEGRVRVIQNPHMVARNPERWSPEQVIELSDQENWLAEAVPRLKELIEAHSEGIEVPNPRVIVDIAEDAYHNPERPVIGVCRMLSPTPVIAIHVASHAEPLSILATLAHEMVHAALDPEEEHGERFAQLAEAIGLEGRPEATVPGPDFEAHVRDLIDTLGEFPDDPTPLVERIHIAAGQAAQQAWSAMTDSASRARTLAGEVQAAEDVRRAKGADGFADDGRTDPESAVAPESDESGSGRVRRFLRRLMHWTPLIAGIAVCVMWPPLIALVIPVLLVGFLFNRVRRIWKKRPRAEEVSEAYRRVGKRAVRWSGVAALAAVLLGLSFLVPPLFPFAAVLGLVSGFGWWRALVRLAREVIEQDLNESDLTEFELAMNRLRYEAGEALRLRRLSAAIDRMNRTLGFVVHQSFGWGDGFDAGLLPDVDLSGQLPIGVRIALIDVAPASGVRLKTLATRAVYHQGWLTSLLGTLEQGFEAHPDNVDREALLPSHPPAVTGPERGGNPALAFLYDEAPLLMRGWFLDKTKAGIASELENALDEGSGGDGWADLALQMRGTPLATLWRSGHRIGEGVPWLFVDSARIKDFPQDHCVPIGTGRHAVDHPYTSLLARVDLWEETDPGEIRLFAGAESGRAGDEKGDRRV